LTNRRRCPAIPALDIELLLRDIDVSGLADGHHRRCAGAAPLQRLEMLEQWAMCPFTQGEEVFPEAPHMILDGKALDLRALSSLQLDAEGFLSEALMRD
jgi:hypothetical protein